LLALKGWGTSGLNVNTKVAVVPIVKPHMVELLAGCIVIHAALCTSLT
jgi:hypothetical protein